MPRTHPQSLKVLSVAELVMRKPEHLLPWLHEPSLPDSCVDWSVECPIRLWSVKRGWLLCEPQGQVRTTYPPRFRCHVPSLCKDCCASLEARRSKIASYALAADSLQQAGLAAV